jgi:shikimate dehydrogenase
MGVPYAEVIGDPVSHSKSPLIHKFWLKKLGIEGDYRATRVPSHRLSDYLAERKQDADWRGCNVTSPHKVAIVPMMDGLFETVKVTGAVNTVRSTDGALVGANTDLRGFAEPFRTEMTDRGSAFLIGAGGAARAIYISLAGLGFAPISVGNRTVELGSAMLKAFGARGQAQSLQSPLPPVDLVVNASSMGMNKDDKQLDLSSLPDHAIVYDIVYNPVETKLISAARARGLRTIDGLSMLIGQAAAAFCYFFDGEPPRQYDAELRRLLTS